MTREQGLNLVKMYDNFYPKIIFKNIFDIMKYCLKNLQRYLINNNKNLFEKINGRWQPKFNVGKIFYEDRNC